MGRRIYIISSSMKIEDAIEDAKAVNCSEIVHGIPLKLEGIIDEADLPMVFEEPSELLIYRYEIFSKEITHPKINGSVYIDYEIVDFQQELTPVEITALETQLGRTVRRLS